MRSLDGTVGTMYQRKRAHHNMGFAPHTKPVRVEGTDHEDTKSWTHDNLRPLTVMARNIHHKAMKTVERDCQRLSKESGFFCR